MFRINTFPEKTVRFLLQVLPVRNSRTKYGCQRAIKTHKHQYKFAKEKQIIPFAIYLNYHKTLNLAFDIKTKVSII